MMPVKQILATSTTIPGPPILVIDEATIKQTCDAGPVCECDERYWAIRNYKPFLPGGINPYNRRKITDGDSYDVTWKRVRTGACGYAFEKPIATHRSELPENYVPKDAGGDDDDMFIQLPQFSESYYQDKLREKKREHVEGCNCPTK